MRYDRKGGTRMANNSEIMGYIVIAAIVSIAVGLAIYYMVGQYTSLETQRIAAENQVV
jgi:hypothetical protein